MGVKPVIHILLMIVTLSMLVSAVLGGVSGEVISGSEGNGLETENEVDEYPAGASWIGHIDVIEGGPVFDSTGSWDDEGVSSPTVVWAEGKFRMWYTGYDGSTIQIGYATSDNGIEWEELAAPVLAP